MKEIRKIISQYDSIDKNQVKLALASVVDVEASSYRRIGARMLVQSNGLWTGGISGGCLEGDALKRSQQAIFKNTPSTVVYDTMEDDKNQIGIGLGCNGRIEVLFNPIDPNHNQNEIELLRQTIDKNDPHILLKIVDHPNKNEIGKIQLIKSFEKYSPLGGLSKSDIQSDYDLVRSKKRAKLFKYKEGSIKLLIEFLRPEIQLFIAGDNYDIHAMLGISTELGWKSTIIGNRKKLTKRIYQSADKVIDYAQASSILINEYTVIILMTHDYNKDLELLKIFKGKQPAYLGILGPKKRFISLQKDIGEDMSHLSFLHSPSGLEIGAESPEEIALSICSEIIAIMRNKRGESLHYKKGSIHDRD